MRTTVYENQFHDTFIVNEFNKNYYVCTYVKTDHVEPEAFVVHSKAAVDARISVYIGNEYTIIHNYGKKLTPKFGMAVQYFTKDDFLKILSLFSNVATGENLELLLEFKYIQADVDKGHNWFEIDEDGDVFTSLHEKFISQSSEKVKLEDFED